MTSSTPSSPVANPAETYDSFMVPIIFEPWAGELLTRVRLTPGEHVLDVACGTGAVSFQALDAVIPGGSVTAADISPGMLAVARRKAEERGVEISFVEADAEHPPLRDGGYDVALIQQGLQFFPDSAAALKATHDAIRPAGRIAVAVWQPMDKQDILPFEDVAIRAELGPDISLAKPFSYGGADRLRRELGQAGFSDIQIETVSRQARFPSALGFVSSGLGAAASVMPQFASVSPDEIAAIATRVYERISDELAPYRDGEGLIATWYTDIGVAIA